MADFAALQTSDITWDILDERVNALDIKQKEIAQAVVDTARKIGKGYSGCNHAPLREILGWREDVALADVFRPDGDAHRTVVALLGDKAAILFRLWDRVTDLPYRGLSRSTHKRPLLFRSRRFGILHNSQALNMLGGFIASLAYGFTTSALREMEPWKKYGGLRNVLANLYGLFLDESDQAADLLAWMEQELRERIQQPFDEWAELPGFRDLIVGMLSSHNIEAHQAVGRLALDRTLPEYCRRIILEYANTGTREGFANLLRTIGSDVIVMYASCEDAYCQWLGVNADAIDAENVGTGIHQTLGCLTDAATRHKFLSRGDNVFWVHQALWATGQDGLEYALDACRDLAANGTRPQKISALYYAGQFREAGAQALVAATVLANPPDRDDDALVSLAMSCLNPRNWQRVRLIDLPEADALAPTIVPFSRDDARRVYALLKHIADQALSTGRKWFGGRISIGGEFAVAYSLDDVFLVMVRLLGREREGFTSPRTRAESERLPPSAIDILDVDPDAANLREDVCRYFPHMGPEARRALLGEILREGIGGPMQRETYRILARTGKDGSLSP